MSGIKNGVMGVVLGVIVESVIIWQKLLLYTEATKHQLIGGGIFGLFLGLILGSAVPLRLKWVVTASLVGFAAIALFDQIVNGEMSFPGLVFALYLLGFLIAASLSFLGLRLVNVFWPANKPKPLRTSQ